MSARTAAWSVDAWVVNFPLLRKVKLTPNGGPWRQLGRALVPHCPVIEPLSCRGRASVEVARRCCRGIVRVVRVEAALARCPPGMRLLPGGHR